MGEAGEEGGRHRSSIVKGQYIKCKQGIWSVMLGGEEGEKTFTKLQWQVSPAFHVRQ